VSERGDFSPVYVMTYDHLGIVLWRVEAVTRVIDQEVERLAKYPDFKVGWDHEAYTYDHLAEHAPELLERMREALARFPGRLGVGTCTYGQPLAQFINEESNIRQLTMALETVERRLDRSPSVYVMSEHAMHSQMPQLLVASGFRGAIMRTHFMMYGYNPTIEAPVVWWVGLDGSHIPAVPTYPGQEVDVVPSHTSPFGGVTQDNRILTDYPRYVETSEEWGYEIDDPRPEEALDVFRRRFGGRVRPLVASRADDPRQSEKVIAVHEGDPAYTWVLAEEVFDYLPQPRIDFQPGPNDFGVRMPWGLCGNWIWNRSREAEVAVLTAERLAALTRVLGGEDFEADLEVAWKDLLVGQHHDIQIVGLEEDAHRYLDASVERSSAIARRVMDRLAGCVGTKDESRWVVFNPLPWERTDWIATGADEGFVATVPALGFRAFPTSQIREEAPTPIRWDPDGRCLETVHYTIRLGERGGLEELFDCRLGQPVMVPGRPSGTLAGVVNGEPYESEATVMVEVGDDRALICEEGSIGPLPYRAEWTVYSDLPRIEWRCELETHGERIGRVTEDRREPLSAFEHEYKVRLRFYPCVGREAVGIRDLPFAVAETADRYVEGNYWTGLSDGDVGVAFFNRGLMGAVREGDGAFSVPLAYSMFYVWDNWDGIVTDESVADGPHFLDGTYRYELAVAPFGGNWREADLHRHALAYNFPCLITPAETLEDSLGKVWLPCQVKGDGAILSALYGQDEHTYARFYEYRGQSAEVSMTWLGRPVSMVEVDLRGKPLGALGRTLPLGPWQVRTVRVA
jgi:alpha-mannosidase